MLRAVFFCLFEWAFIGNGFLTRNRMMFLGCFGGLFSWVDIMSRRAGVLVVMSSEVEMSPANPASN